MDGSQVDAPVATTRAGKVSGYVRDGINIFKGVPYGDDTRSHRFRAPRPAKPWDGVREATNYGPRSPQNVRRASGGILGGGDTTEIDSEDCLVLNVWTPALRDGGKRPVMVWLHGGGYTSLSGASAMYDGARLCQKGDVVVVTLNHRLNVFGYLYLAELLGEDYADSGHAGMFDIIAALEWVRDEIAEFGGDASNVTIFGESGGGGKVMTLMASRRAQGLFHRAAVQSGSLLIAIDKAAAADNALGFLDAVGLKPNEAEKLLELPTEALAAGLPAMGDGPSSLRNLGPVIDGRNLERSTIDPASLAISADIPLLVGTNTDEMTLLFGAADPALFKLSFDDLPGRLASHLPGLDVGETIAALRAARSDASASDLFFAVTAERMFRHASILQAARKTALGHAPAWHYELTWRTPVAGGRFGAPHALDIPLIFDNVERSRGLVGDGEEPQVLADQMSDAWLAFARTGDPNTDALTAWAPYDEAGRATMVFDLKSRVEHDRQGDLRRILHTIPPMHIAK
jgi:para-nitrobenzyl esterase